MKQLVITGLTLLFALSSARVVREAGKDDFKIENFMEKIESGLKDVEKFVLDATGAANTDELKKLGEDQLEVVVNQFHTFADKVKKETEHLQENDMVKDLRHTVDSGISEVKEKLETRIAKYKEEHPESYNQIASQIETVKKTSSAIASKIEELTNSEDAQRLKESSLKFLDDLKNGVMSVVNDLKAGEKKD